MERNLIPKKEVKKRFLKKGGVFLRNTNSFLNQPRGKNRISLPKKAKGIW